MNTQEIVQRENNSPEYTAPKHYIRPDVDIFENEDALLLIADLPGVSKEKLSVKLQEKELTILGERSNNNDPDGDCPFYDFRRVFTVNQEINADAIEAHLKDGVLTVELPKSAALKMKEIPISL